MKNPFAQISHVFGGSNTGRWLFFKEVIIISHRNKTIKLCDIIVDEDELAGMQTCINTMTFCP